MTGRVLRMMILIAALASVAALVSCGSDDDDDSGGDGGSGGQRAQTETAPDLTDTSTKPVIEKPTGSPPRQLVVEDIVKGKGRAAKRGDTLVVHYVGVSFSNGQQFDSSWDSGQPFPVKLGAGQVIPGWEKGLLGMRKGGRRKLLIPPELAYGARGYPPAIAPNETLVFVVDAIELQ